MSLDFAIDAAKNGREKMALAQIEKGVDVNAKDKLGMTMLHWAAFNGHKGLLEKLLDLGADVHSKALNKNTALHFAAESGHVECVELLIERGANVNDPAKYQYSPLHFAAKYGRHLTVAVGGAGGERALARGSLELHAHARGRCARRCCAARARM